MSRYRQFLKLIALSLATLVLNACSDLAVMFTPKKQPIASTSQLANHAQRYFWDTLHQGNYDDIDSAIRLLTAAYIQNPNDPQLASHLGFLHIWKITERHRARTMQPTIVDEIILARKYFTDAVTLNAKDPRTLGFLGDSQLSEGQIFHDERLKTRGYYTLKSAIHAWPEFNYFSAGYPMSSLAPDSTYFKEGLEWQWQTLDRCIGKKINRNNPDYTPYMALETQQGPKRACWNSWIAPHNFEGFFLNMGDMLVKSGDWQTAIKIYNNAKLARNYETWPHRALLEARIAQAQENVVNFQKEYISAEKSILFNSGYGCVACHQQQSAKTIVT